MRKTAMMLKCTCDGCDRIAEVEQSPDKIAPFPSGFQRVSVLITTNEVDSFPVSYLLCRSCFKELTDRANPESWPRARVDGEIVPPNAIDEGKP